MATKYEHYDTGWDEVGSVYGDAWVAQTFTPATAHKITSVKLELFRSNSPGTVTVSIRATDGSGHPTGGDLCSGTTNGNTLPTSAASAEWREITLGAGYNLDADTKYAIVVRAAGVSANRCQWLCDKTSPTYAGGCREDSANAGVDWSTDTSMDFMFEDWGEAAVTFIPTVTIF